MNDIGGNGGRVYWISATPYVHYIFWAANLIFDAFFFQQNLLISWGGYLITLVLLSFCLF